MFARAGDAAEAFDVIAKMLYASVIREKNAAEAVRYEQESMAAVDQRIATVWNASNDVLLLSQRVGDDKVTAGDGATSGARAGAILSAPVGAALGANVATEYSTTTRLE